jgi:hypothetical protein
MLKTIRIKRQNQINVLFSMFSLLYGNEVLYDGWGEEIKKMSDDADHKKRDFLSLQDFPVSGKNGCVVILSEF